jgi:hypothetical protein
MLLLFKGGATGNATAGPGQYGVYNPGVRGLVVERLAGARNVPYSERLATGGANSYTNERYIGSYPQGRYGGIVYGGTPYGQEGGVLNTRVTPYAAQVANYNNPKYTYIRDMPVSSQAYVSPEEAKSDWYYG